MTIKATSKQIVWLGLPDEPERLAMADWFARHGIDPNQVPGDWGRVSRHCLPDLPGISLELYVFDEHGKPAWKGGDEALRETVWIPMEADPMPFPAALTAGAADAQPVQMPGSET